MKDSLTPLSFYEERIDALNQKLKLLYKKRSVIAWIRFLIFITACAAVFFLWHHNIWIIIALIITGIILFLIAISKDTDNKEAIKNFETLLSINKEEINYLNEAYSDKYNGEDLAPNNHAYAKDLDIFGEHSLFQYTNRCNSEQGIILFAERLLQPLAKHNIFEQQKAIKELSAKIVWLQQFQAFGMNEKITIMAESRIQQWVAQDNKAFINRKWKILLYVFPLITLSSVYLYLDDILPAPLFSLFVIIFFFIAFLISKKIQPVYTLLSKLVPVISILYKQINWFEQVHFKNEFLLHLKNSLGNPGNQTASSAIKKLQTILNRFDVRLNVVGFIILNTFFLWDLWQMVALNKWKDENKTAVAAWFNVIPQLEAAGSFATLYFNHPHWCFPQISDHYFTLEATQAGHPLIPQQQSVVNNFALTGTARIDLITGSNMAGKSTFLRCLGVNMILAYTGSPVCAESFTVSVAQLMSSMRIEDNLSENTSTFYAELKKLKLIIEAVNKQDQPFILLDEILRGTNSFDRHSGSIALIKQLIKKKTAAIIATHDVELASLENEFPSSIKNFYFDVQVSGDKLFFDYKLKEGVCHSMNASILMKQIGIEL